MDFSSEQKKQAQFVNSTANMSIHSSALAPAPMSDALPMSSVPSHSMATSSRAPKQSSNKKKPTAREIKEGILREAKMSVSRWSPQKRGQTLVTLVVKRKQRDRNRAVIAAQLKQISSAQNTSKIQAQAILESFNGRFKKPDGSGYINLRRNNVAGTLKADFATTYLYSALYEFVSELGQGQVSAQVRAKMVSKAVSHARIMKEHIKRNGPEQVTITESEKVMKLRQNFSLVHKPGAKNSFEVSTKLLDEIQQLKREQREQHHALKVKLQEEYEQQKKRVQEQQMQFQAS